MKLVVVESPYAPTGDTEQEREENLQRNLRYARAVMRWCLLHDKAPIASHLLYTQPGVLDDEVPEERMMGIEAGLQWADAAAEESIVGLDLGMSKGMQLGVARAESKGRPVTYIKLGDEWETSWLGPTAN